METFRTGLVGVPLRSRLPARLEDVIAFLNDEVDEDKLHDLIWGLLAVEYPTEFEHPRHSETEIPFEFGVPRLLVEEHCFVADRQRWNLSVGDANAKPDPDVFHALGTASSDAIDQCVTRASRRLKSSGLLVNGYRNRRQAGKTLTVFSSIDPERLLAAMLFPLSLRDLERVANSVLYPPESED
jgi:CRISPR-associated protein Csx17